MKTINVVILEKGELSVSFEFEEEKATLLNLAGNSMELTRDQAHSEITRLKQEGWKVRS